MRKEKLGDRITALQQLVSPFGKVTLFYFLPQLRLLSCSSSDPLNFAWEKFSFQADVSPFSIHHIRGFLDGYCIGASRGHRIHQVPARSSSSKYMDLQLTMIKWLNKIMVNTCLQSANFAWFELMNRPLLQSLSSPYLRCGRPVQQLQQQQVYTLPVSKHHF